MKLSELTLMIGKAGVDDLVAYSREQQERATSMPDAPFLKTTFPLSAFEPMLTAELKRLPQEHRCFVIAEDTVTKKFVQFAGPDHGPILVDLPILKNDLESLSRAFRTFSWDVKGPWEHNVSDSHITFMKRNLAPEDAAKLAMLLLREVHLLPEFAVMRIVEESTQIKEPS